MPWSECRFIKRISEFLPKTEIRHIPANSMLDYITGKYADLIFSFITMGMSAGEKAGITSRMKAHNRKKGVEWTHFTIFEVHDNITNSEIYELEGMFRHIYRKDTKANRLNKQVRYKKFRKITSKSLENWKQK